MSKSPKYTRTDINDFSLEWRPANSKKWRRADLSKSGASYQLPPNAHASRLKFKTKDKAILVKETKLKKSKHMRSVGIKKALAALSRKGAGKGRWQLLIDYLNEVLGHGWHLASGEMPLATYADDKRFFSRADELETEFSTVRVWFALEYDYPAEDLEDGEEDEEGEEREPEKKGWYWISHYDFPIDPVARLSAQLLDELKEFVEHNLFSTTEGGDGFNGAVATHNSSGRTPWKEQVVWLGVEGVQEGALTPIEPDMEKRGGKGATGKRRKNKVQDKAARPGTGGKVSRTLGRGGIRHRNNRRAALHSPNKRHAGKQGVSGLSRKGRNSPRGSRKLPKKRT